ncbi:MAG TPA: type II CAAX endopeptidase family protein, partial [Verrucomicrobiae bacterium]|nr:type II CAAX endopeptidase family protein [Verrucomicrobiae bacterium]
EMENSTIVSSGENFRHNEPSGSYTGVPLIEELQPEYPPRPRIFDAVIACVGILLLWFLSGFLLDWVGELFNDTELIYFSSFITQAVIALVIVVLAVFRRLGFAGLGYRAIPFSRIIISAAKGFLAVFVFYFIYAIVLSLTGLNPPEKNVYTFLLSQRDIIYVVLNMFLAAVLAPILEETLFRGIIFAALRNRMGFWLAAIFSAALFSGLHFDIWGFAYRMFLGVVLAYLYEKNESLYPSMALHAMNNGFVFILWLVVNPPV